MNYTRKVDGEDVNVKLDASEEPNSVRKVIWGLEPASAKERTGIHWIYFRHIMLEIVAQLVVLVVVPVFATLAIASECQRVYSISDGAAEWPQSGQECFFGQQRNVIENFPSDGVVLSRTYDDPVRPEEGPQSGLYVGVQYLINSVLILAVAMSARIFFLDQLIEIVRRAIGRSKMQNTADDRQDCTCQHLYNSCKDRITCKKGKTWWPRRWDVDRLLVRLVVKLFAIAIMLYTFLCFSWIGIFAIWTAFAAILDPEKNLAKGVILFVVVTVVWRVIKKLVSMRTYVTGLTIRRTDMVLHKKVEQCLRANDGMIKAFKLKSLDDTDAEKIDLDALFTHVLNKYANIGEPRTKKEGSQLNFKQFVALFQELKMTIPLENLQRMFQYCDENNDGVMTTEEFYTSWEYLRETVAEVMMIKLGLDDSSIIKHVGYFLLCFAICIPLFLMMIALWDQSSSFVSVTQSFFIGATGVFASNRTDKSHDVVKESKASAEKASEKKDNMLTRRIDNIISRFMT